MIPASANAIVSSVVPTELRMKVSEMLMRSYRKRLRNSVAVAIPGPGR